MLGRDRYLHATAWAYLIGPWLSQPRKPGRPFVLAILAVTLLISAGRTKGQVDALKQDRFLTLETPPNLVLVRTYGDLAVLRG